MAVKNMELAIGLMSLAETLPMRCQSDRELRNRIRPKDKATKQRRAKNKAAAKSRSKNR